MNPYTKKLQKTAALLAANLPSPSEIRCYYSANIVSIESVNALWSAFEDWKEFKSEFLFNKDFWVFVYADAGGFDSTKLRTNPLELEFRKDYIHGSDVAVNSYFLYARAWVVFDNYQLVHLDEHTLLSKAISLTDDTRIVMTLNCSKPLWVK